MELSNTPALGAACSGAGAVGTAACRLGSGRSSGLERELPGQLSLTCPAGALCAILMWSQGWWADPGWTSRPLRYAACAFPGLS